MGCGQEPLLGDGLLDLSGAPSETWSESPEPVLEVGMPVL
jgi:hypothetical protein